MSTLRQRSNVGAIDAWAALPQRHCTRDIKASFSRRNDYQNGGLSMFRLYFEETYHILNPQTSEDDSIPLSEPVETSSGTMQDSVVIPKGTTIAIPIKYFNQCEAIWGPDAKQFVPERWLKEESDDCKDSGRQHLYAFSDGPRICLGRVFGMAELKVCMVNRVKCQ